MTVDPGVVRTVEDRLTRWRRTDRPTVVAVDGRSGTGKSSVVRAVAERRPDIVVVEGDDFYVGGSLRTWRNWDARERADRCIRWKDLHAVLRDLVAGRSTTFAPFDWDHERWDDDIPAGGPRRPPVVLQPAPLVVVEGVYSARAELADVVDRVVLLELDEDTRRRRLTAREGPPGEWDALWGSAEAHYFAGLTRTRTIDLVIDGSPARR